MVRKRGFEPRCSCERQPLKLVDLLCSRELAGIHGTDVERERAGAHASDDFIRTHSHMAFPDEHPCDIRALVRSTISRCIFSPSSYRVREGATT
jgi:hypothetical protein